MPKKILLACSNYFPHNFGGTEVYVESYTDFLQKKGDVVYIITTAPSAYFSDENTVYEDESLKVCRYYHLKAMVFGINYQTSLQTDFIHSKNDSKYMVNWENFVKQQPEFSDLDVLHIQSFTATIGLNLFKSVIKHNTGIKVITSYHTPISCPKETLLYGNTLSECQIKPDIKNCTACLLKTQTKLPYFFANGLNHLYLKNKALPAFVKTKHLVQLNTNAFEQLKNITDQWWCYSEGIRNILKINQVPASQIKMVRHGINSFFLNHPPNKPTNQTIYLFNGRLVKIKGIVTLLQAWLKLPVLLDKQLWITAKPFSENIEINNLVLEAKKREDIHFLGEKNQKELLELYSKSHFVIIPSECFEIGPFVFHEAVANQCNVICSDIGGCKELAAFYHMEDNMFETGNEISLSKHISQSSYRYIKQDRFKTASEHYSEFLSDEKSI
ncbi:MAG: glycosyltransferase [Flavobacterium sp.]|nr:MAG: glycosyltransferase [Flavobacterium sp.]